MKDSKVLRKKFSKTPQGKHKNNARRLIGQKSIVSLVREQYWTIQEARVEKFFNIRHLKKQRLSIFSASPGGKKLPAAKKLRQRQPEK